MPLVGFGSVSSFDCDVICCHNRRCRTFEALLHRQCAVVAMIIFIVGTMLLPVNAVQAERDGGWLRPRHALVCSFQSDLNNLAPRTTRLERFILVRGGESFAHDQSNVPDDDLEDQQQQQLLLDEFRAALRLRLARDRTTLAQTWAALEQDLLERRNNHTNAKTTTENTSVATTNGEPLCTLHDPAGGTDDQEEEDATQFRPRWFGWGRHNIALHDKQRPKAVVVSNSATTTMNEEMDHDADQSNNDSTRKVSAIPASATTTATTISVTSIDSGTFKNPFPIKIKKEKRKTLVSDLGMEWSYPPDSTSPHNDEINETNVNETDEDGTGVSSVQSEYPTTATQRIVLAAVRVVVQCAVWACLILCTLWVGQVVHSLLFGIGIWMSTARVSPPPPVPAPSRKQKLDSQSSASAAATAAPLTKRLLNKLQRH
jgi:hypothetical protein